MLLETDELVPAIVKYARKPGKSSKSERIQPLGRVHVMLRGKPSDELAYLENIAVESPHAFIKGDLLRFGLATTMAEIVLHLVPDWGQEPGIYTLLAKAMAHLDDPKARAGEEILALFELRTLDLAGVLPPLDFAGRAAAERARGAGGLAAGRLEGAVAAGGAGGVPRARADVGVGSGAAARVARVPQSGGGAVGAGALLAAHMQIGQAPSTCPRAGQ